MIPITHPSPNHKPRPAGAVPRVILLHGDAGNSDRGTLEWCAMSARDLEELWKITPPARRPSKPWHPVSYHALVGRNGTVSGMVDVKRMAFHAGESVWNGVKFINAISIGLAFANKNDGKESLSPVQIAVMLAEVEALAQRIPTLEAVTTHSLVSPGRKFDPDNFRGFELEPFLKAFDRGVKARP